jgi:hypothetical protein
MQFTQAAAARGAPCSLGAACGSATETHRPIFTARKKFWAETEMQTFIDKAEIGGNNRFYFDGMGYRLRPPSMALSEGVRTASCI